MTSTDELRRLLDERGVEYKSHYLNTSWYAGMKLYMATDDMDGTLTVDNLTAEQAIAATLGSEPPYGELLRCLENDWNISASWDGLRKFWCIELTEDGVKLRDATHGMLTAEQVREVIKANSWPETDMLLEFSNSSWQAIADELNARAERTCRQEEDDGLIHCSNCGGAAAKQSWAYWNYCPNCGARVIGTEAGE